MDKWITWELFEELFEVPARSFLERLDYKNMLIYIGGRPNENS